MEKKNTELTVKQGKFLQELLKNEGDTAIAYRKAYTNKTRSGRMLTKKEIRDRGNLVKRYLIMRKDLPSILDSMGLGLDTFCVKLNEQLNAQKTIFYQGKKVIDVPDNGARSAALKLHSDVLGLRRVGNTLNIFSDHSQTGNFIIFNYTDEQADRIIDEENRKSAIDPHWKLKEIWKKLDPAEYKERYGEEDLNNENG